MKKAMTLFMAVILLVMNMPVEAMAGNNIDSVTDKSSISENSFGKVNVDEIINVTEEPETSQFMIEDTITGVNDETFKIARPNPDGITKVNAESFGLSPDNNDNYDAFTNAIKYCKEHPNTCLDITKGIYHFRTEEDIKLNGLNNILIDGNGSEFIFSTPKYFKLSKCNGVEFRELAIDWDTESPRLASLVKIYKHNKTAKTMEIEFMELDEVDVDIPIICFMQYDQDILIPGSYGGYKTFYPGQVKDGIVKREKVAPNRIKLYMGDEEYLKSFHDEEVYLIRHYTYGGRVFQPTNSENITFDDIHIYTAAGMGYIVGGNTKYFQIINSSIGRRPDRDDAPYISTTADGIHILNTGGYFRIENCDFSFTGDDIINIHDDVMTITKRISDTVFEGVVTGDFVSKGDKVSFKNIDMDVFEGCENIEAEVVDFTRDPKTYNATITFKEPVNGVIDNEGFIYRTSTTTSHYVIRNNYIHETKGRAMLVLGSNALVEGNRIYRIVSEGIHVLADIDASGGGSQGVGASDVTIRGNTFIECTHDKAKQIVRVGYKNGDRISECKTVLSNITIEDNKFIGCYVDAIYADNTTNLTIKNNLIQDSGQLFIKEHCDNVINTGNTIKTTEHDDTHDVIFIQGRAPSCVSYGMKSFEYCNDCHRKVTEIRAINPISHNSDDIVIANKIEATCTSEGSYDEVHYCSMCDKYMSTEHKTIAIANHNFDNGKCRNCDYQCPHEKNGISTISKEAINANDVNSHFYVCAICNARSKENHTFTWIVDKEATKSEAGLKHEECSVCKYKKAAVVIDKIQEDHVHSYIDTWKSDAENHWKECACGDKKEVKKHTFGDGVVIKEPTYEEAEEALYTCSICKATEKKYIDKLKRYEFKIDNKGTIYTVFVEAKDVKGKALSSANLSKALTVKGKKVNFAKTSKMKLKGYTLKGFYNGNKKVKSLKKSKLTDGMIITARFTENTYTVSYKITKPDKNVKVKGKIASVKAKYTEEVMLDDGSTIEADGYKIIGWTSIKNGKEVEFAPGQKVKEFTGKKILYPIWGRFF